MDAITWMIRKFSRSEPTNGTPPIMAEPPYPVLCGLLPEPGGWKLVIGDNGSKRLRVVIVPSNVLQKYDEIQQARANMNAYLGGLPFSYRKRKRRVKVEDAACVGVEGEPE